MEPDACLPPISSRPTVPATVYLDSQDFSNFAPSSASFARTAQVREELLDMKAKGLARFVFSDIHIFETMPVDPVYARGGMERLRTIAEFCGENNVPSSIGLIEFELKNMLGMRAQEPLDWFPLFEFPEPGRASYEQATKEMDSPFMNRKARRHVEKMLIGRRTAMSNRDAAEAALEFVGKFPFLTRDASIFEEYFAHKKPWSSVKPAVERGLRDIVGFSVWLVDHWDHGQKFVAVLRGQNEPFLQSLVRLRETTSEHVQKAMRDMHRDDVAKSLEEGIKMARAQMLVTMPSSFASKILGTHPDANKARFSMEKTPSLMVLFHFLFELVARSAAIASPRKPLASDFADASHAMFAGRVDLFRADRFACEALERLGLTPTTRLVSKLEQLPAEIMAFHEDKRT